MKKQKKTPEKKKLNKMGPSNLADTEFKTLIISMLKALNGNFNKERVSTKKDIDIKK